MNELKQFDALTADIAILVAPTLKIQVTDPDTSQAAIETAQTIKDYLGRVEKKRKELVGPMNDQVKAINEYCKQIVAPLNNADTHVRAQLNEFARQQEVIRRAEEARIQAEKVETERLAAIERERVEEELRVKQEAEAEAHAEAAAIFGHENGDIEAGIAAVDEKLNREWEEKQVELNREAAMRRHESAIQMHDAGLNQIKNTRVNLKVRVIDIDKVPKEFLIVTVNEKALLAVGRSGVKIAGIEFIEELSVAIGAKTRMPRLG